MLKLLEEPPPSTIIIIIAQSHQIFLPTILSRVKVIAIKNEKSVNTEGFNQMLKINGAGDALYLAQEVSKTKIKQSHGLKIQFSQPELRC